MKTSESIFLGIIQGLTEFLPISSSGHLVLVQNFFQMHNQELLFDISLHIGTLLATILILRKEVTLILKTLIHLPRLIKKYDTLRQLYFKNKEVHLLVLLIVGSMSTALIGLLFNNFAKNIFGSVHLVGSMLIISGSVLLLTKKIVPGGKNIPQTQIVDSLIIGIFQGIAIIPGISRSGITISTGLFLGMNRKTAGRYSFLLSIPTILGALLLNLSSPDLQTNITINSILLGTTISTIIGCISLKIMLKIIESSQLHIFAPYCCIIGFIILVST